MASSPAAKAFGEIGENFRASLLAVGDGAKKVGDSIVDSAKKVGDVPSSLRRGLSMPSSAVPTFGSFSSGSSGPPPLKLKIMTWNIAIVTFPLVAPSFRAFVHLCFFWGSAHNRFSDVSLVPLEASSLGRLAQQADYIRQSDADIVMLQEVPGKAFVDSLMMFLGSEFDCHYASRPPTRGAKLMYLGFTLFFATMQFLLFEPVLRVFILPYWLDLSGGALGRWLLLVCIRAMMMRTSTIVQFLLGSVGGQLVTLRRRTSLVVGDRRLAASTATVAPPPARRTTHGLVWVFSRLFSSRAPEHAAGAAPEDDESVARVADFWTFPRDAKAKGASGHLGVFSSLRLRPRGVLDVSFPVVDVEGRRATLRVLNTHLPHACDTHALLTAFGRRIAQTSSEHATVVVGGDFNPLPSTSLASQFGPLLAAGCEPTNGLESPVITWDFADPLTRSDEACTPHSMQLDFLFLHQQPPQAATASRCRLKAIATEATRPRSFFVAGSPLSDHYGLSTSFAVEVDDLQTVLLSTLGRKIDF